MWYYHTPFDSSALDFRVRKFELTVLGCGAAAPTPYFLTTSQLVNIHDHLILIDCGEGCQLTLRKKRLKFQRIKYVLISHMHADHVLGLPGLLASMNLLGRKSVIEVYGPQELESFVKTVWDKTGTHIDFEVNFHIVDSEIPTEIIKTGSYVVKAFPTKHRVKTCGFRIEELSGAWNIKPYAKEKFNLSYHEINQLKRGENVVRKEGVEVKPSEWCVAPYPNRSYVFAADTAFTPKVVEASKGATLLYHEATFMESEKEIAKKTMHSTAADAGKAAKEAKVSKLIIGHFSNRYRDLEGLLNEAKAVFENTYLAADGDSISID
ncbi:MAG: ribonuclease [Bacteroidetes bacterium]|nr:MAG: ribonuclease [Bacteroidota bacterium]